MSPYIDLDTNLLCRLQEGDTDAYAILFDTYHKLLYALAYRYLKNAEEAEDAVQYTLMKVWEKRDVLDYSKGVRSLLFTILKNYVLNELRHRKVVFDTHYRMAQKKKAPTCEFIEADEKDDFKEKLMKIVQQLPPQKRKICTYKVEQTMSNQEIADKMNIEVATVKSHYTVALKMLKKEVSKLMIFLVFFF